MTRSGFKYIKDVVPGEEVYAQDVNTKSGTWTEVKNVISLPNEKRELLSMESRVHSSLTTMGHRWFTHRRKTFPEWGFRLSSQLNSEDRIPLAVRLEAAKVASVNDDIVDLVAWTYTEGSISKSDSIWIYQSKKVNPDYCQRIENSLQALWGSGVETLGGVKDLEAWTVKCYDGESNQYHINQNASRLLLQHLDDKIPTYEFLNSLTLEQLDRFIEISILADGSMRPNGASVFVQKNARAIEAFAYACMLAGRPINIRTRIEDGFFSASLLDRKFVKPFATPLATTFKRNEILESDQEMFCLKTDHGTWVAERNGSFYITGNCADHGIPHSEFLSWPEDDQDKTIAWLLAKREVCDLCGTKESDWVDERGWPLQDPPLTPVAHKCHGCAQKEQFRKANYKDGTPSGVTIIFMPSERVDSKGRIVRG